MNKYAISDIHGCVKTFNALLEKINFSKEDELYLLGDYIDRGPDSKGVIDTIWELQKTGHRVQCLKGNHEDMLLACVKNSDNFHLWEFNGGASTMKSFGTRFVADIPPTYLEWMAGLPQYFEVDKYILVHAGFSFNMPNPFDERQSQLWERDWYHAINYDWLGERIIIHGHTPTGKIKITEMLENIHNLQALVIDNGCCYHAKYFPLMGRLSALELNQLKLTFQEFID